MKPRGKTVELADKLDDQTLLTQACYNDRSLSRGIVHSLKHNHRPIHRHTFYGRARTGRHLTQERLSNIRMRFFWSCSPVSGLAGGAVYLAKGRIGEYQIGAQQAQEALVANRAEPWAFYVATGPLKLRAGVCTAEDVRQVSWPENAIFPKAPYRRSALFPENNCYDLRVVLRAMGKRRRQSQSHPWPRK